MTDVTKRLKVSWKQVEQEQEQKGREAGTDWAKTEAEAAELERLYRARDHHGDWPTLEAAGHGPNDAYGPDEEFAFLLNAEGDRRRTDAEDFWERVFPENMPELTAGFVRGFAQGCMDVWEQVRDEVKG